MDGYPKIDSKIEVTAKPDDEGARLDKFLSSVPDIGTRTRAAQLIANGLVTRSGAQLKSSYRVQSGDHFEIRIPPPEPSDLQPLHLPLEIVFEDDDCLVLMKPAGLVVHPAAGHAQDTLVNALIGQVNNLAMGFGERRPGIVHRLDKDTSGLLVVAKNDKSQEALADQFKKRTVRRHYWALVYGTPKQKKKTIESLLARHPTQRKRFCSRPVGKRAVTHYEVLASSAGLSLLRCRLETGRTHQIRVHLSELGHPIVGDRIYGSNRPLLALGKEWQVQISAMARIGLHAYELGFALPSSGVFKQFFAPWPEDIRPLIDRLGMMNVSTPEI